MVWQEQVKCFLSLIVSRGRPLRSCEAFLATDHRFLFFYSPHDDQTCSYTPISSCIRRPCCKHILTNWSFFLPYSAQELHARLRMSSAEEGEIGSGLKVWRGKEYSGGFSVFLFALCFNFEKTQTPTLFFFQREAVWYMRSMVFGVKKIWVGAVLCDLREVS